MKKEQVSSHVVRAAVNRRVGSSITTLASDQIHSDLSQVPEARIRGDSSNLSNARSFATRSSCQSKYFPDWNYTSTVCTASFIANYTHMQRNYGKLKKFYYGAENIMRFVISTVDDQTIERVAAALRNPKEASDLIIADVFRNGYIIAVIAVCLFISFITLVACILQSTLHLFGGSKVRKRLSFKN
ncbi:unnamed protein product [Haemonchus placei]|uniref:ABC transmembrane type-1 domain-containing protein n=1 Tax=Haemonchus placei TaxID=6290 RepID=A0A0N4WJK8_HAEPC|nr:unnamed protein product [Haemonchus placei]